MPIFLTVLFATILVLLCAAGLAVGKLITGKNKLSCRRCGNPEKEKDCNICGKSSSKKK